MLNFVDVVKLKMKLMMRVSRMRGEVAVLNMVDVVKLKMQMKMKDEWRMRCAVEK